MATSDASTISPSGLRAVTATLPPRNPLSMSSCTMETLPLQKKSGPLGQNRVSPFGTAGGGIEAIGLLTFE